MLSEEALIKGCSRSDRSAQKALYDAYCRKMMAVCLRYVATKEEAEDVLQEGFVKVFQNIKNFRGESRLDTWMTRIMINTSLNSQRQKFYLMPTFNSAELEIPEDEEINLAGFHFSELIKIIQSLPDGCRVVFNLYAIEGYGHKEIAGLLGINEGTSKSQYSRAKQLLKRKLGEPGNGYQRYGE